MKTILSIFVLLMLNSLYISADLSDYFEIDYLNSHYFDCSYIDSNSILVCGSNGSILKTTDKGVSWKKCNSKTDYRKFNQNYFSAVATYGSTAICVGMNGLIRISSDKGDTWFKPDSITNDTLLNSIVLLNEKTGVAFGYSGSIIKTNDGGLNWTKINTNINTSIVTSIVTSSKRIIIATSDSKMYQSSDEGENWIKLAISDQMSKDSSGYSPQDLSYSLDNIIYLLTSNFLLKSTDDGENWQEFTTPVKNSNSLCFLNNGKGFFVGSMLSKKIYCTNQDNQLIETKTIDSDTNVRQTSIKKIVFYNENNGIVIGINNLIYATTDGGNSWVQNSYLYGFYSNFHELFFLNDSVGFVSSNDETLFKTKDGGTTWNLMPRGGYGISYGHYIFQMYFYNENKGMAISNAWGGGTILSSNDGFKNIERDTIRELNGAGSPRLYHINQDTFYLYASFYLVKKDFNGNWWNKIIFESNVEIVKMKLLNENNILIAGTYLDSNATYGIPYSYRRGLIIYSSDNGISWSKTFFDNLTYIYNFHFLDDKNGYFFGERDSINGRALNLAIYRTWDGGQTWSLIDSGQVKSYNDNCFIKNNYGIIICGKDPLLFSNDSGMHWEKFSLHTDLQTWKIFGTDNSAFITARSGNSPMFNTFLLKLKLKDEFINVNDFNTETQTIPLGWIFEPYPNPANNLVNFDLAWDKRYNTENLVINIYNLFGTKVVSPTYEIISKTINTGILRWNSSGLPSGIYFVELEVGGYKKVQKVVVY